MTPLNPTDRLSVELEAQQWNMVLNLLANGPFREVQPLMMAMRAQLRSAARLSPCSAVPRPSNGFDHVESVTGDTVPP